LHLELSDAIVTVRQTLAKGVLSVIGYRQSCPYAIMASCEWQLTRRMMSAERKIRIVLADDHTVMRNGLKLLLEREPDFQVIGEAADGRAAIQVVESTSPDVVVMDIAMPLLNGIEAAARITASRTKTAVIVLSMHSDESYVLRALKSGVRGYLLKDSAESDLIAAVRHVTAGKPFFSPAISNMLMEDYIREIRERGVEDSYELLTLRERELLQLTVRVEPQRRLPLILS